MTFVDRVLDRPRVVTAITLALAAVGVLAFRSLPLNLFPDTNRPMVRVVTEWPGAAADDVATQVTHPIEVRLSGLDGVRRVTSASRDQVSGVTAEFEFGTDISSAATDVANELPRVRGLLPAGVKDPLIFKITDAARPVVVLAVSAGEDSGMSIAQVRRLVENPVRDVLLAVPEVAEAEVFGGEILQVSVDLDRDRLLAHGLSIEEVGAALEKSNVSIPSGLIRHEGTRLLLTTKALAHRPQDLADILVPVAAGDFVRVGDLGHVAWGSADPTSYYRGNGGPAVAVALLRTEKGHASSVLPAIEDVLPKLRERFPELNFGVADTQGRLIDLTVDNMLSALRDAVLMTLVVLLMFIGNTRAALVTAFSLPMTYLLTFVAMKVLGYEFNMVTLTAVIIAVGLLADDAVVVIENTERRMRTMGERGIVAAAQGTKEILLADAAGTVSTVIVLIPIMYVGGYVQTVLRPLAVVLSIALFASLLVSVTIIPLLSSQVVRVGGRDPLSWLFRPFERFLLEPLKSFFVTLVSFGLRHRAPVLITFAVLFVISARLMPVLGRELMPLMDTGTLEIRYEAEPDTDVTKMAALAEEVEAALNGVVQPSWIISTSHVIGSEPAVKSFGSARTLQQGVLTVNLVDRFQRDRTQQQIQDEVRARVAQIPGLISTNVFEFGATPLSSLRGTVDIMVSGPDPRVLDTLGDEVLKRLMGVSGLSGVERSWQGASTRWNLDVDVERARLYGLTAAGVSRAVARMVGGLPSGVLRVQGENPIPVVSRLLAEQRGSKVELGSLQVPTPQGGSVPLAALAGVSTAQVAASETHQALLPTVDVIGYRRAIDVVHLQENVEEALEGLVLPRGYTLSHEGEIKQMGESFGRLGLAIALGLGLLYLMLVVTFRSFLDPFAIMGTLPLALIGANWAMLLAGKHGCLPSFMGLILLMGIVVNNGILLIDFAKVEVARGRDLREAILQSVRLRTRPILMTAAASAVGMLPIALEWAVGIERLSPLAVVAIGGLLTGTFLTLLVVPILFYLVESARTTKASVPAQQEEPSEE